MTLRKTSKVRSFLAARSKPGQRDSLIEAFVGLQVFEECRQSIPGFISGELLVSAEDPDAVKVSVLWADRASWQSWQDSPLRMVQQATLLPFLSSVPSSTTLVVHATSEMNGQ